MAPVCEVSPQEPGTSVYIREERTDAIRFAPLLFRAAVRVRLELIPVGIYCCDRPVCIPYSMKCLFAQTFRSQMFPP